MVVFDNVLLNKEVENIFNNNLPQHTSTVGIIIHTETHDYYPDKVIGLDVLADYNANLTAQINTTLLMGGGDFNDVIHSKRDNLQVTTIVNYNGKITETRYKAILLNHQNNSLDPDMSNGSETDRNKSMMIEVKFQLLNLLYMSLRMRTINGVIGDRLDNIIRHFLVDEIDKIQIDSEKQKPVVDIAPIHNTRIYQNIIIKDTLRVLDIADMLHNRYGLYNGGIGTYIHTKDGVDTICIFPTYNSDTQDLGLKLVLYIPDNQISGMTNKTAIIDNDELRVIVNNNVAYRDNGETSLEDEGVGFNTLNSNNVVGRIYKKKDGVVTSDRTAMIDSQSIITKTDGNSGVSYDGITDNLYMVRSKYMFADSKILQAQWNCSRPDLLFPGMRVEVVYSKNGKIYRENGSLLSDSSSLDNSTKTSQTLLNVMINNEE